MDCYRRNGSRSTEQGEGRWRSFDYEDLVSRDKASLDIFWLRDESLEDAENLPAPELILQEIMEDLEGALAQLREMAGDLEG